MTEARAYTPAPIILPSKDAIRAHEMLRIVTVGDRVRCCPLPFRKWGIHGTVVEKNEMGVRVRFTSSEGILTTRRVDWNDVYLDAKRVTRAINNAGVGKG